ncbi:MAG: hypothetical protein M1839_007383 [Geoglossum umbratile]|nr:MAG: hypothetical protein M1839_007383 [Geoglossum umbratile]
MVSLWALPTASVRELILMKKHTIAFVVAGLTVGLPVRQAALLPAFRDIDMREVFQHSQLTPAAWYDPDAPLDTFKKLDKLVGTVYPIQPIGTVATATTTTTTAGMGRPRGSMFQHLIICAPTFCILQLALLLALGGAVWATYHPNPGRSILGCSATGAWTFPLVIAFMFATVGVSWTWGFTLVWKQEWLPMGGATPRVLIVYRKWGSIFWDFIPGVFQAFMLLGYTMLLSSIFSASVRASALRVLALVGYLALSRSLAIYVAMALIKSEAPLIINCGDRGEFRYVKEVLEQAPSRNRSANNGATNNSPGTLIQNVATPPLGRDQGKGPPAETATTLPFDSPQLVEQPNIAATTVSKGNIPPASVFPRGQPC